MNETTLYIGVSILIIVFINGICGLLCYFLVNEQKNIAMILFASLTFFGSIGAFVSLDNYASMQATDTEIWGGSVTGKSKEKVSCEHSYQCHCHEVCSGSGNERSCSNKCDTCYEHPYDVDWNVATNVGKSFTIDRVDRQGLDKPARWEQVAIGDPVAVKKSYKNWIKAAKYNILGHTQSTLGTKKLIPVQPKDIYDYWKINQFVSSGITVGDYKDWDVGLMKLNSILGPTKQASVIVVITNEADRDYGNKLYDSWQGASKNDIVVVIGAPQYPLISWAGIYAMTQSTEFQVNLREALQSLHTVDRVTILNIIQDNTTKYFVREHMHKYEYLKDEIVPPINMVAFIVGIICVLSMIIYCGFWWTNKD